MNIQLHHHVSWLNPISGPFPHSPEASFTPPWRSSKVNLAELQDSSTWTNLSDKMEQ